MYQTYMLYHRRALTEVKTGSTVMIFSVIDSTIFNSFDPNFGYTSKMNIASTAASVIVQQNNAECKQWLHVRCVCTDTIVVTHYHPNYFLFFSFIHFFGHSVPSVPDLRHYFIGPLFSAKLCKQEKLQYLLGSIIYVHVDFRQFKQTEALIQSLHKMSPVSWWAGFYFHFCVK